jgi:integrase/recombinase XerD
VTNLRKLMLEELERRNYAASTTVAYLRAVQEFACYFNRSPDQLGPDHIRQYQAYLFRERKLGPNTVTQHLGGIRFFYIKTLRQSWSADLTPYPKKVLRLPSILSREEVNSLIEAAPTPFQRALLMALYATGLRRAELASLKITDIDSARDVIHVQGGKGRKDRDVMLSQKLLEALREHWRSLRRKPPSGCFPATAGTPPPALEIRPPAVHKRKLKLLKERKVPDTGFFMCATACCPHKTGRSDAPKRC